jgi:hypothetical protein
MAHLEPLYNAPQLDAIHAAVVQDGITLIQVHTLEMIIAACRDRDGCIYRPEESESGWCPGNGGA